MSWFETAQEHIRLEGLAGWLLYDFRGSNPIARRLLGLGGLITRRVFLLIPASGEPTLLVHAIERGSLPRLPYRVVSYSSRQSLERQLEAMLPKGRLAMEYSPRNDIPYLSLVDAGTIELLRDLGVEPVSSGDLLQPFSAWNERQLRDHEQAVAGVYRARDAALAMIAEDFRKGERPSERDVQACVEERLLDAGLTFEHGPIIGFGPHAGDPHYVTPPGGGRRLEAGDAILLDIFARKDSVDSPYADITWMAVAGAPSGELAKAFSVVRDARDAAVEVIRRAYGEGRPVSGAEADRAARSLIEENGYGEAFIHRTGHSLGIQSTHGDGVHLDDFETSDTRRLLPGSAVTVEPGIYLPEFGVRSEINLVIEESGPRITTEPQQELTVIPLGD